MQHILCIYMIYIYIYIPVEMLKMNEMLDFHVAILAYARSKCIGVQVCVQDVTHVANHRMIGYSAITLRSSLVSACTFSLKEGLSPHI